MSGHETPKSSGDIQTPGVTQCIAPETADRNLKNSKSFCRNEGMLPHATPLIPL